MKFTEHCIKRPVFTTVMSLLLIVLGIIGFTRVAVRGYPNVSAPVVMVMTTYDGASASVLESQITTPIENELAGLSGIDEMKSYSQQGMSRIILKFNIGVNIDSASDDIRSRLNGRFLKRLPTGVDAPIVQKRDPDQVETLVLSLSSATVPQMAMTDYANRNLVPELQQLMGVANVDIFNPQTYAMHVYLNPTEMAARGVTVNDMSDVLQQQNINVPSGEVRGADRDYNVMSEGLLKSPAEFSNLVIRNDKGYLVRFGDVSKSEVGPAEKDSVMRVNGKPMIGMSIYAESTANPVVVANEIRHAMKGIQASMPANIHLKVVWDDTTFLQAALYNVKHDLIFAILLVIGVVLLFLGSWRSTLIPLVTIPICLISVFAFIYFVGFSLNIFTLLALVLAIGLVVDDAIVMLENIYRHLEAGMTSTAAAIKGSKEIGFAVIAMTITLAAVYAPIGFAQGMTGIIFREFAYTLAMTVIISGFVALTLSPMMCAKLLKPTSESKVNRYTVWLDKFFDRLHTNYKKLLGVILKHRAPVVIALLIVAGLGVWCFQSLPSQLSPREDQGFFAISIKAPADASFPYIDRYAKQIESIARKLPDVVSVQMMLNTTEGGFGFVLLKPWDERNISVPQLINQFNHDVKDIAGVKISAFNMQPFGGSGKGGDALQFALSANISYQQLHNIAESFMAKLKTNPNFTQVDDDIELNSKQYVLHINQNLAASSDVNVADINNALKTMLGGAKITSFTWNNNNYDVILQVPDVKLQNLDIINQLYVRNSAGKMIALSSLATISETLSPQALPHIDRQRADMITANLAPGYDMSNAIKVVQQLAKTSLPDGVNYTFKGAAKSMLKSSGTMALTFGLALVFIYLVLAAQFESFIDPFIILFSVPLSVVAAMFVLKITGHSLSIYTNIGFVTLIGLITKHGILITEFSNQLRAKGVPMYEAIAEAASLRLRAILMTTMAMVIGAIPLAFASGAGAIGRQQIGWVIVGGMLFGTFFSLIVVPVAYSYFGKFKKIELED